MENPPGLSLFLEKNYGLRLLRSELAGASNEVVLKIQTVDNQWFGLKIYRSAGAPPPEKLAEIWGFTAFLASQNLAVQSPVAAPGGQLAAPFLFEKKETWAVLFCWLDGRGVVRFGNPAVVFQWGALLGRAHLAASFFSKEKKAALTSDALFGFFNETNLTVLDELFIEKTTAWLSAELRVNGFSKKTAALFEKSLERLAARHDFFEKGLAAFGHIHSDLHPGNLLRTRQGLAAIDWDDLALGPFLLDIGVVFNELRRFSPEKSRTLREAFLDGYRSARELPEGFPQKIGAATAMADMLFAAWVFHPENGFVREGGMLKRGRRAVREVIAFGR